MVGHKIIIGGIEGAGLVLSYLYHPTTLTWSIHLVFAFILSVRVIMKRPGTGVALAWLLVINAIPIFWRSDLFADR